MPAEDALAVDAGGDVTVRALRPLGVNLTAEDPGPGPDPDRADADADEGALALIWPGITDLGLTEFL